MTFLPPLPPSVSAPCPTCGRCPTCGQPTYPIVMSPQFVGTPLLTEPYRVTYGTFATSANMQDGPTHGAHGDDGSLLAGP